MAIGVGMLGIQQAQALQINWSSVGNAELVFSSAKSGANAANAYFSFKHSTQNDASLGWDFQVNGSTQASTPNNLGNPDSAVGDYGLFTGKFTITSLMETPTSQSAPGVHFETASVTASVGAQVIIVDKGYNGALAGGLNNAANLSHEFKATVTFDTIFLAYMKITPTQQNPSGLTFIGDGISSQTPNVTGAGMTGGDYTGTSLDLKALASTPSNLSGGWSFNSKTLQSMTTVHSTVAVTSVSDNGNFQTQATVPDGGMTLVLLGFALSGVVLMKRQLV